MKNKTGKTQFQPNFKPTGKFAKGQKTSNTIKFLTTWGLMVSIYFLTAASVKFIDTTKTFKGSIAEARMMPDAFISPTPSPFAKAEDYDIWVGEAVDEFFGSDHDRKSEVRMIMHCLLFHESHHSTTIAMGDNGMAGGPLQYWEDTWQRMRGHMIEDGYATNISTRFNMRDAIFTTVYALNEGWGKEWGPILRDSEGSGWATCPTPSWY